MSSMLRGLGSFFGFGRPQVDRDALAAQNRDRLRAQARDQDAQQDDEEARIRSARGGRRAMLASRRNLITMGDTLG